MNKENKKENAVQQAEYYLSQGLHCAQSVLKPFLDDTDNSLGSEAISFAYGFGGGIDDSKQNTCGALIGVCMAIAIKQGESEHLKKGQENKSKHFFSEVSKSFREKFGSTICYDMCEQFKNKEKRYKNCKKAVLFATKKAADVVYK